MVLRRLGAGAQNEGTDTCRVVGWKERMRLAGIHKHDFKVVFIETMLPPISDKGL